MVRRPRGKEVLALAQQQLVKTSAANELRILQVVVLPLAYGLSTLETAVVVGRNPRWVTSARNNYINNLGISRKSPKAIRNNAHMSTAEEAEFLAPFLETA
jgi:translation elongation factor EF-1beta